MGVTSAPVGLLPASFHPRILPIAESLVCFFCSSAGVKPCRKAGSCVDALFIRSDPPSRLISELLLFDGILTLIFLEIQEIGFAKGNNKKYRSV